MAAGQVKVADGLTGDAQRLQDFIVRRKRPGAYLGLEAIREVVGTRDNARLFQAISPLVEAHVMEPTKNARRGGSAHMPLFEKYRVRAEPPKPHDLTELNPILVATGHLERHPVECDRWWAELCTLSRWLETPPVGDATLRERCWEVFGDEKATEGTGLGGLIAAASGADVHDLLRAREDEPEDLPLCVRENVTAPASVVVSENRDPYLAIRRGLVADAHTLFGVEVDAVVWGRGYGVAQWRGRALARALETMHAAPGARVLYWGDIDRAGLTILSTLFEEGLASPLVPAYEAMLAAAGHGPRVSPDGRDLEMPDLTGAFEEPLAARLAAIAEDGRLLPQEALSARAIREAMA